jgi:phospholipid/cholesterol/gamma-HCH transport system permease protein
MLLSVDRSAETMTLRLQGHWSIAHLGELEHVLASLPNQAPQRLVMDCRSLLDMELSAAWLFRQRIAKWELSASQIDYVGEPPVHFSFMEELVTEGTVPKDINPHPASIAKAVATVGKYTLQQTERVLQAVNFVGHVLHTGVYSLRHPRHLRVASITRHVYEAGFQAIAIVAIIAFLITVVIAYIGAQELRKFGADIFTVDLVTVGVLREMGVLLTAIIVAGRSGSAYAAEIGVMQLNDEVDALKAMGVDPYEVLVWPRVIGLIIAMPLLVILADAMGLIGGAVLCSWLLDISPEQYMVRVQLALEPTTFWAGLLKAPVFAFLIAITGTYRGMQVRDSSRELGRLTTVAVVQSILLVMLANAVFAIVYRELDF